ncbi:MAG: hypothetical protein GF398_08130 [Chitinivibrionales bacterium]|nr:hypothetical protein [Chitinivibrionales bacterium]
MNYRRISTMLLPVGLVIIGAACRKGDGTPGTRRSREGLPVDTFTVMAYNVENLFDFIHDGSEYPEYVPGRFDWTKTNHDTKVGNIAKVINAADADVVLLAEVENARALRTLNGTLSSPYPFSALADTPHPTVTCPALLSRFEIASVQTFGVPKMGAYHTRNILEADLHIKEHRLKVFVNHWPSKRNPESHRVAAATVLAHRLEQLPAAVEYLIAGDLNEDYNECALVRSAQLDDTQHKTGINHVIRTVESAPGAAVDYVTERELPSLDGRYHYNPWLELPTARRMSHRYKGRRQTPDHFLLPRTLYDSTAISYVDNSFSPFTWQGRLLVGGEPLRWQMRFRGSRRYHVGEGYSDHLPLLASFHLGPFTFARGSRALDGNKRSGNPAGGEDTLTFESNVLRVDKCGESVTLERHTRDAHDGATSLRIRQPAQPGNGCAARLFMSVDPGRTGQTARLIMHLKGQGRLNIRIRCGGRSWVYFNNASFSPAKSARYFAVNYSSWRKIALPLEPEHAACSELEIEIRAGRDQPFNLLLDTVYLNY